jgi:Protein of unknown function DUF72
MTELLVAARGWMHPGWRGAFYPPDLPDEWRLDYYANEFRGVLVPFETLRDSSAEDIALWRESVGPGFWFALELRATAGVAALLAKCTPLAGRIAAILLRRAGNASFSPASLDSDLRTLRTIAVAVDAPADDPALLEMLARRGAGLYWPAPSAHAPRGGSAIGRLQRNSNLQALRAQIEEFLSYAAGCPHALLVAEGASPDVELMRQAKAIGELLGH